MADLGVSWAAAYLQKLFKVQCTIAVVVSLCMGASAETRRLGTFLWSSGACGIGSNADKHTYLANQLTALLLVSACPHGIEERFAIE